MSIPLPHNRDAEESLIGSVLLNPALITQLPGVAPDDFYVLRHKEIWAALQDLGKDITPVTVAEKTGDMDALLRIINNTHSALHAEQYAEIVRSHSRRRKDIQIAREIVRQAQKGDIDRAAITQALVSNEPISGGARHVREFVSELVSEVEERSKSPREVWGLSSGFPDLDKRIGGLHTGQTILLAAPPGVGKSVLAMQIALNVALRGNPVVIYSFEMSAKRVLTRMLSARTGISTRAMNTGYMSEHWDAFYEKVAELSELPIQISDIYGMTSFSVRADLARLSVGEKPVLMVVDYLNKLLDSDGGDDLSNTKLKAQRIQGVCREFDVHGILIQSMNKEGMKATVPHMSAMSGPADVAHEGDNVFLMGKDPNDGKKVHLYPAKLRDGDMGTAKVTLQWAEGRPMFVTPVKDVKYYD